MKLHEAESVNGDDALWSTYRRAVPGGWVYQTMRSSSGLAVAMVFVPDPTAEHVTHGAEGAEADVSTADATRTGRDAALREAADLVVETVVHWREVGQLGNQNDRAGFKLAERIRALAKLDGSTSQTGEG